jgi:DNA-binding CsgD family transcriptional regulator
VAEQLFANKGFDRTTLSEVARAAGITENKVREFFEDKESLNKDVLERVFSRLDELLESVPPLEGLAPIQTTETLVGLYVDFLAKNPTFIRLLDYETWNGGKHLTEIDCYQRIVNLANRFLSQGVDAGVFKSVDIAQLIISFIALCYFYFSHSANLSTLIKEPFSKKMIEARKRHVVDLILYGILSRGSILTPREHQVMLLLFKGKANKEISEELQITLKTVKNHLNHIYRKLGIKDREEAIAMAPQMSLNA